MVFSSYLFLFFFLPLVILVNRFLSLKASNVFLLLASLLFYASGEGLLVLLLLVSIFWNFSFGLLIEKAAHKEKKLYCGVAIIGNLSLLAYYKYFRFLVENSPLAKLITEQRYSDIILPIGISFFTFQGISYLVDVYRKEVPAEKSIVRLGLFISFFPQLVAGPIVKYKELAAFLSHRVTSVDKTVEGSMRFIRGLAKKVIIADTLAIVVDAIFIENLSALPTTVAWTGVLLYSLQIYYDFSGYSDMAIGLGLIFGFRIPENFNYPYISKSVREFWRRWHISLSTWFRDYLYIPLGGNRQGQSRTLFNLCVVFFLTGLWHGASWNFVLWGMLHGLFLILERLSSFEKIRLPHLLKHIYLLVVVGLSWVLFRLPSFADALVYYKSLFSFSATGDWYSYVLMTPYVWFVVLIAIIFAAPILSKIAALFSVSLRRLNYLPLLRYVGYFCLALLCMMELSMSSYSPFIYFKF